DRLRTALTADNTHGLPIDDLRLRINACSGTISQAVANDLRQMAHELVIVLELILLDSHNCLVIGDADQQIAPLGVEKCRDRLENSMRDNPIVLLVLFQIPA